MSRAGFSIRREEGSATIWVLALCAVVVLVALMGVCVARAVGARHQAQGAADLSALAAAGSIGRTSDPCLTAARIAAANGVDLVRCALDLAADGRSGRVEVQVARAVRFSVAGAAITNQVLAHARAVRLPAVG